MHGGDEFEILVNEDDEVLLCLHKWDEHKHPSMADPSIPAGIKKSIIKQIQTDLLRLNYELDRGEVSKAQIGNTTKDAIVNFQIKNNMSYGGLDWATINRLKTMVD